MASAPARPSLNAPSITRCRTSINICSKSAVEHEFLTSNRLELIELCRSKVALRPSPEATDWELAHGIPTFLDQLIKTLEVEQLIDLMQSRKVSGPSGGANPVLSEVSETAALHGRELLQQGFTVEQVVHDYGDLCQAITEMAFEQGAPTGIDEFHTLNRCLDNGIADAVTEFNYQRDSLLADKQSDELNQRLGFSPTNCATSSRPRCWRFKPLKRARSD